MIVTFHLAVYFVYYVWNTYISHHITDNASTSNNSRFPQSNNSNGTNPTTTTLGNTENDARDVPRDGDGNGSINRPDTQDEDSPNTSSSNEDQDIKTPKNRQAKEGEGDFHPCLSQVFSDDGDKGRDMIYNVEPEYGCICSENKIQFFPPVYIQRYMEIERILKEPCWAETVKKVIDFGCAELSFEMKYLKKFYGIEEIVAVDIDSETLEKNCCKVMPCPTDYLKKRPTPLSVRVFCGSVAHTHDSLTGADAVIAIEMIEHLFPPELDCLPFTIFGFIKPKIAIFTTPNSDFNVLFTGLSGFRHPDHKFEWSQQQFEEWGHNLVQRYPDYQVMFKGIGPGPPGSEKYGCCSQMATFVKINDSNPISISDDDIHFQDGPYTLIGENVFPYFKDERTKEEKVRDAAECFINNCKMRSRVCDEVETEIPIKSVMGRIKYYDKEKLKEILMARSWQIKISSSGEEVVVLPDSEEEEEDSEPEPNEYVTDNFEYFDKGETNNSPAFEENWDNEGVEMDMTLTFDQEFPLSETIGDHVCVSDESYCSVVDIVNTTAKAKLEKLVCSDKMNFSSSEKCSTSEINVPDIELSDKLNSSQVESFQEKDTNLNFEKSIYETPHNNGCSNSLKSGCDFYDCSLPLSDKMTKECKRALVMESPNGFTHCEADQQSEDPFCCLSTVSSSCDTSIYATPCCSERHRNNITKCLSLQQISTHCGSPAFSTDLEATEGKLVRDQKDKFSKSMEGFKSLESDLTCSSTSKVVDSGYPDSYSEYNMDMDLTPEQFDDIETESEENDASSRSLSPPLPPPQIPWLIDDVQNGDVANNNRDGEGNNLVADMEEEALEFEARIDEINNEVLNLAVANDAINFDHNLQSGEPFQEMCGDCLPCVSDPPSMTDLTNDQPCMFEMSPNSDWLKLKSFSADKNTEMALTDSLDKQSLRSTKSDTSIATNCSWNLDLSDSQINSNSEGVNCHRKKQTPKFKTHTSLTTVLDGHSKFSNCSLVRPVQVYQVSELEKNSPSTSSKSMPSGSREPVQQETSDAHATTSLTSTGLQDDRQSLVSVYQSAESLTNMRELRPEDHIETSSFPDWLLNILISDINENEVESVDSVQSVWDSDSLEERMEQNYDVQVDVRGGGDPQRDPWH